MSQPVKSTDPRKPAIVAALKAMSGCRKVTTVRETSPGFFEGNCMWPTTKTAITGVVGVNMNPKPDTAAPAKKPSPKLIVDACAASRCVEPPLAGGSYCAEHQAKVAEATKKAKAKIDPVRAQLAALIEGTSPVAAAKPPKAAKQPAQVETDATAIIAQLRAKGWSDQLIGEALGIKDGNRRSTVGAWRIGKPCYRVPELASLVFLDVPSKDVVVRPAKAKAVTGSLRAPDTSKAAKSVVKFSDPRQLVLALRDALDEVLAGGKR